MSKTVFVFPNLTKPQVLESLEMVLQFLGESGVQVVLPTDLSRQYGTLSFSEKVRIEIAFAIIKDYDNIYINNVLSCFDRKTRMYFCKLIIKLKK